MKVGDLVRFCGSYLIQTHDGKRFCMSKIEREGIVCEIDGDFISILSEGENCLVPTAAQNRRRSGDIVIVEVINE